MDYIPAKKAALISQFNYNPFTSDILKHNYFYFKCITPGCSDA